MISFNRTEPANSLPVSHEPPFVVQHLQRDVLPSGSFTPDAQLIVTRQLRTSRLLPDLPDNEARTLLALLAFLSANGRIEATAAQVAELLNVSEAKALDRLHRLCRIRWHGEAVACERTREDGTIIFGISDHVVGIHPAEKLVEPNYEAVEQPPSVRSPAAGREVIIAQSRAAYGRPRAEVEREIAEQLGYLPSVVGEGESTSENNPVARRLLALGVAREQVNALLAAHDAAEITDQLDWLPMRRAKNPARFIVAAIQNSYEPPARVRLERAIAAEEAEAAGQKLISILPSPDALSGDLPVGGSAVLALPDSNGSSTQIEE